MASTLGAHDEQRDEEKDAYVYFKECLLRGKEDAIEKLLQKDAIDLQTTTDVVRRRPTSIFFCILTL